MSLPNALQTRPPLTLAIGLLEPMEQNHVQIALRVIASRLPAPCTAVLGDRAELVLGPRDDGNGLLLTGPNGSRELDRPLRIVPLAEAINQLAGDAPQVADAAATTPAVTDHDRGGAMSDPQPASVATADTHGQSLLHLLLKREEAGPLHIVLDNGDEWWLDARYHSAYSQTEPGIALQRLSDARVSRIEQLDAATFAASTEQAGLRPLQVSQLCWSLAVSPDTQTLLGHWHANPDALLQLDSWPNLSRQGDGLAWLRVLAQLSRRSMSLAELRRAAEAEGITPARARHGLSLLLLFRHARIVAAANDPAPLRRTASATAPTHSGGLLGRLRQRLRALAG
ncbi:hypothetical protein [Luteimonas sp. e5]